VELATAAAHAAELAPAARRGGWRRSSPPRPEEEHPRPGGGARTAAELAPVAGGPARVAELTPATKGPACTGGGARTTGPGGGAASSGGLAMHGPLADVVTFFIFFPKIFAEGQRMFFFSEIILLSACLTRGKLFAECPRKGTRQRWLCRSKICRALFAECLRHSANQVNPVV
jgi:hypothetical protein